MSLAFPVMQAPDGQGRVYAPVELTLIKDLAEAVRKYGVTANFTLSLLDRLARDRLTPQDWQDIAKATLSSMGQYLEWKALWLDAAQDQARTNQNARDQQQRGWTFEMITGQGRYANDQTNFAWGVYAQTASAALRAWRGLTAKGGAGNQLTKIIQGPQEPFADFVARMTEAAARIFGDENTATPLIEQLIFEQATQECRSAITPRKSKGLQDWLKVCREIGGPLTNAGLAAAILQSQKKGGVDARPKPPGAQTCYNCGRPGHFKRECRAPVRTQMDLCSRCKKGYHKPELCRSVRDINGRLLPPAQGETSAQDSKNGMKGPWSQGPKKYGTKFIQAGSNQPTVPATLEEREWSSVQPPRSY